MTGPTTALEFSRPLPVERLPAAGAVETIEAGAEERRRLAERFKIVAIDRFAALIRAQRREGGLVQVSGRLEADVVQTCVVTLEPFPSHVEDSFSVDFTLAPVPMEREVSLDPDDDPPEPVEDGIIDIGELAAQYLSLALDPHPRAPGVMIGEIWSDENVPSQSPFAALEKLKSRG